MTKRQQRTTVTLASRRTEIAKSAACNDKRRDNKPGTPCTREAKYLAKRVKVSTGKRAVERAAALNGYLTEVYTLSLKPEGTEARKALKRNMTFKTIPQNFHGGDKSDAKVYNQPKSPAGAVRPVGNKTDVKINSYYAAKRGDNLPR